MTSRETLGTSFRDKIPAQKIIRAKSDRPPNDWLAVLRACVASGN